MSRTRLPVASRRLRLDRVELAVLVAFAAISVWVLALNLWQVAAHGRVWTGTDGLFIVDQLQYLSWVREASRHVLVSNLFVLHSTPADYFQPAIAISGGLTALGVPAWLSLLLWKPVAVVATFYAVREYVGRSLSQRSAARAALVLALFFGSFTIIYGSAGTIGDLFLGFLSWGYVFGLLSVACMAAALLSYDRLRAAARVGWAPGALGALASLLHPWHGELLVVTLVVAEAMMLGAGLRRRRILLGTLTVVLTALPLVYYELLGRLDVSWQLARVASKHSFPLTWILLALVPLLVPALAAYAKRPVRFLDAATRSWPVAALIVYVVSASGLSATPLHAFEGITIPLSVLAVEGWQRLGWSRSRYRRPVAVVVVAAFTLPAVADQMRTARQLTVPAPGKPSFIARDERRALDYLARDPTPGGVLSRSYLGALVPGETGRHTLVGDCLWSEPNCAGRLVLVRRLFTGGMTQAAARSAVQGTGARFLLADCRGNTDLTRLLGPLVQSLHTFGCGRVIQVR